MKTKMFKFIKTVSRGLKAVPKKALAIMLAALMIGTTLNLVAIFATATEPPATNYPALEEFTSGTGIAANGNWSYSVRDFAEKAMFEITTDGFDAPLGTWDANDSKATVTWDAVTGATGYTLVVFEGTTRLYTIENLTATQWETSATYPLEGGKTYEMQVLAYTGTTRIAASKIRTFKAVAAKKIVPEVINDFSNTSDLSDISTSYSKAASNKETINIVDNQFVITTNAKRKSTRVYLNETIESSTAKGLMFFIKPGKEMLQYFRYEFAIDGTKDAVGSSLSEVYYVSAANPNNITSYVPSSKNMEPSSTDYAGYGTEGYYVFVPISNYIEDIQNAIKNGTCTQLILLINSIRYKDSSTGNFNAIGNFDGSDIIFDDFCLVDDIDGYIKQMQKEYNKVNNPDAYNQMIKEENAATAYAYTGGAALIGEPMPADQFADDTLTNATAQTGYKFYDYYIASGSNKGSKRKIVFSATSQPSFKYGTHMKFTAPADGIYDFGGAISVESNSDVEATVKYRLTKLNADGKEIIITNGGDWYELEVTSANKNPKGAFPVSEVALKQGESVAIEVYEDSGNESTVLNISLGNPTATVVTASSGYAGSTATYKYTDYFDGAVFNNDGAVLNQHEPIVSRWNTYSFKIDSGNATYYTVNNMRPGASWTLLYNSGVSNVAGYHYTENKVLLKGVNVGVALEFIAPKSGSATVTVPISTSEDGISLRVLKNGVKVYPADADWAALPTTAATLNTTVDVDTGDKLNVEIFAADTSGAKIVATLANSPSVTLSDGKSGNNLSDNTFSPLWERPYKGSTHVGSCVIPAGAVFGYGLLKANGDVEATDYYDSYSKSLYKEGDNTVGYVFDDEAFKFAFGNGTMGMALDFNVPTRGYYDLSSAFTLESGVADNIKVRVMRGEERVYPTDSEWAEFTESLNLDALEIGANVGNTLRIEMVADGSANAVINMATPVIQRLNNRQYTESGNVTVYKPSDYTAFEKNYNGTFVQLASRYTYTFGDGTVVPTRQTSADGKLYADADNSIVFADGKLKITAPADSTAQIEFKSPMAGSGKIALAFSQETEFTVLINGEVLTAATADEYNGDIDIAAGDTVTLMLKGTGSEIIVDSYSISLIGLHNNKNSAEDDGFYAVYADPYADEFTATPYEGKYERNENDYWDFAILDVENDKIFGADSYSAAAGNKLYNESFSGSGYYFGKHMLTADINAKASHGIALGFTAPRGDTFNARYGFRVVTAGFNAKIRLRLIKATGDDGDIAQIWPSDTDWFEKTVTTNEDITIPYAELGLKTGDTVYLEAYAVDSNLDNITVNLVSPAFIKDKVEKLDYSDVKAKVYSAYNYAPYSYVNDYFGEYIPMENRFNFYFANINAASGEWELFKPDKLRNNNGNEYSYYSSMRDKPKFIWNIGDKTVNVKSYVTASENTGASMQFISPYESSALITATPIVSSSLIDGAVLNYRIVKRSAEDGSVTTVWPQSGEWEAVTAATPSQCANLVADVKVGDTLDFQAYWTVSADKLADYLANSGETFWNPEFSLSPTIVVNEWINTARTAFDTSTQYISNYLINPYWMVQYKLNETDSKWSYATRHQGTSTMYWRADMEPMLGCSNKGVMAIQDDTANNSLVGNDPVVAWLFKSKSDSRITMGRGMIVKVAGSSAGLETAKFRVTINDKPVYGWVEVNKSSNEKMVDVSFEIKAGDEVRFEVKGTRPIEANDKLLVSWKPSFSMSNEINVYTETDDIYNMLDEQMLGVFSAMDGTAQFDQGFEANKSLSARIKDWLKSVTPFNYSPKADDENTTDDKSEEYIEDTYKEWTEEIYTPGEGGWQKVVRYKTTAWWVYALIIGGSVIAAGGVALGVILIIKKKKQKI